MFRKMRRIAQQLSEAESIETLRDGKTGILGVIGDDGYPYTVPVNYAYADGKLYFHCAKVGHKIDAINACDKVSLCVVDKDDVVKEEFATYYKSVVAFGRAKVLETDEEIFRATAAVSDKYGCDKAAAEAAIARQMKALCCVEITVEHMTGKEAIHLTRMRSDS